MGKTKSNNKSNEVSIDKLDPTQLVNELTKIIDDAVKCARMEHEIYSLLYDKSYKIYEYNGNDSPSYTINVESGKSFKRVAVEPYIYCKDTNDIITHIYISLYSKEGKICFQLKVGNDVCYRLDNISVRNLIELYCNLSELKEELREFLNNKLTYLPKTLELLKKVVTELDILTK
jgi:hypothetical protein